MPLPGSPSIRPAGTVRVRGCTRDHLGRIRIRRRDYYLLERLGNGARQRYLAFDPLQGPGGDFFLIQQLPPGSTSAEQLQVLRRLKDDTFPRVVEWQRHDEGWDLALTWIEGISLADYFELIRARRRPPVAPGEAVRLIHGLANGVCKLYQKLQVNHGDIQPGNLILTSHPSRLMLIDFGSAWTQQRATSRHPGDGYHPCYAAPEQQDGSVTIGFHAAQFSVSMLLYQMLTGTVAYGGLGAKAARPQFRAKAESGLLPPSRVSKQIGALPRSLRDGIDRVTLRGVALDPEARYPDRHAWLDDLFEVRARMRLRPELSASQRLLTRVVEWFVLPRSAR